MAMDLQIELRQLTKAGKGWLGRKRCQDIALAVFRRVKAPSDRRVLSVVMVGPTRMTTLARRRGKHSATDVLAFSLDAPMLGEIFLCPGIITARARDWGRTPQQHAQALFVHGLLHLLGYDHERQKDAREMEQLERKIVCSKVSK